MAHQQNPQQQQAQQQQDQQRQSRQRDSAAQPQGARSEDLLPAGDAADTTDGRFEVAEEVNMDQQSDATRRVGQAPKGNAADALAQSLAPDARRGGA